MANVVLKTEEEQGARITPLSLPPASVEAVEASAAAPIAAAASVVPSAVAVAATSSTRRYDQATIEKALALAMELQQTHQATLTAEQVVRLGEEINVDRAFVLKALSQLSLESPVVTPKTQQVQHEETPSLRFPVLPYADRVSAVVIPSLFGLFWLFVFRATTFHSLYFPLFMYVLAPLLALFLGVRLRRPGLSQRCITGLPYGHGYLDDSTQLADAIRRSDGFACDTCLRRRRGDDRIGGGDRDKAQRKDIPPFCRRFATPLPRLSRDRRMRQQIFLPRVR